jgi:hypothetical protein
MSSLYDELSEKLKKDPRLTTRAARDSTSASSCSTPEMTCENCGAPLIANLPGPGTWLKTGDSAMCRNIKPLFNFDPPVTDEEIRAAALQFVRKVSGFNKPSQANEPAFRAAVDAIAKTSTKLLGSLETNAEPRTREKEAAKARARAAKRFRA